MIKIWTEKTESSVTVYAEGHAGYAPRGQDIVCAGVSALFNTLLVTVERNGGKISNKRIGEKEILEIEEPNEYVTLLVGSFIIGCTLISEAYPKNVQIV